MDEQEKQGQYLYSFTRASVYPAMGDKEQAFKYIVRSVCQKIPREAALKPLVLDDNLAEAHASLGLIFTIYDWDWAEGINHYFKDLKVRERFKISRGWSINMIRSEVELACRRLAYKMRVVVSVDG